jgi:hypothetical protein
VLRRLSVEYNRLYRFRPLKQVINRKIEKNDQTIDKKKFSDILTYVLGDFSHLEFSNIENKVKNDIILWAEQTLEHQFDYLGSGLVKVDPIDWHSDFKTGFTWHQGKFYLKYIQVDLSNDADVKVPRELSRCHHLLWLGEAYLLTKDEKYAEEIVFQIENWIDKNSLMYSINWCCAMDVSIRAINWMYAVNMIMESPSVTDNFNKILYRSLFEHGFFIYNNLEKGIPYSNNHYASDIVGLLFLSQIFPENKYSKKWWNFALPEFYKEVREEVLPSGVHFEKSVSYHRLMTELFAYSLLLLKRVDEYVPIDVEYRIKSMFDFVAHYIKPNGLAPMISDNDDGRLLPFYKYDLRDHRYLLSLAALLYEQPEYKYHTNECVIDNYFLYGQDSLKKYPQIISTVQTPLSSYHQDAGFVILRSEDAYLFVVNGGLDMYQKPTIKPFGTHIHADLLSFELAVGENDVFVDPGAYIYTANPKANIEFRSTRKHNTIVIDGRSQYNLDEKNVFVGSNFPFPQYLFIDKQNDYEICRGKYQMMIENRQKLEHQRTFYLYSSISLLKIEDYIKTTGNHQMEMFFHLAPEMNIYLHDNCICTIYNDDVDIEMIIKCTNKLKMNTQEDTVSPSYGILNQSKTLRVQTEFVNEINITTNIKWKKK